MRTAEEESHFWTRLNFSFGSFCDLVHTKQQQQHRKSGWWLGKACKGLGRKSESDDLESSLGLLQSISDAVSGPNLGGMAELEGVGG